VKEAYLYAVEHPDHSDDAVLLRLRQHGAIPATPSCFVKETTESGEVVRQSRSACGVCVDIAQVMRLRAEGKSGREVRAYVDAQYSLLARHRHAAAG
jgi:hypothetical protein